MGVQPAGRRHISRWPSFSGLPVMRAYAAESVRQEQLCRDRAGELRRQAVNVRQQAAQLADTLDAQSLRAWRRDWDSIWNEAQRELPPLQTDMLSHYPATAALLF